jgi:hypothetical protein
MSEALTGGCQCGAVRFRVERLGRGTLCHCRMCQKQFGAFYGPLITGHGVTWTRGAPGWFRSSNVARRGFCAACGTPLAFWPDEAEPGSVELAMGAFDDPERAAPVMQLNPNDKLSFVDGIPALPMRAEAEQEVRDALHAAVVSYQHPDHDTAAWPPRT